MTSRPLAAPRPRSHLFALTLVSAPLALQAQQPGNLDPSFDGDGKVTVDVLGPEDRAYDIAQQSDGRFVVVGSGRPGATFSNFAVARFLRDGALDASFGNGGRVAVNVGFADEAHAVAFQPDGKIVVAGFARDSIASNSRRFAVVRLDADGRLDPTFANGGTLVVPGLPPLWTVALQRDGRIVVGGGASFASGADFFVARQLPDGSFDPSFGGGDGRVSTPFPGNGEDVVYDLALQPGASVKCATPPRTPSRTRAPRTSLRLPSPTECVPATGHENRGLDGIHGQACNRQPVISRYVDEALRRARYVSADGGMWRACADSAESLPTGGRSKRVDGTWSRSSKSGSSCVSPRGSPFHVWADSHFASGV